MVERQREVAARDRSARDAQGLNRVAGVKNRGPGPGGIEGIHLAIASHGEQRVGVGSQSSRVVLDILRPQRQTLETVGIVVPAADSDPQRREIANDRCPGIAGVREVDRDQLAATARDAFAASDP